MGGERSIQKRIKDPRVECGLTLEQLAEQTHLSKSALGSYEADDFKDISHYALIKLKTWLVCVSQTGRTLPLIFGWNRRLLFIEPLFLSWIVNSNLLQKFSNR